jgi:uncharacterized delta-60 repeat protein
VVRLVGRAIVQQRDSQHARGYGSDFSSGRRWHRGCSDHRVRWLSSVAALFIAAPSLTCAAGLDASFGVDGIATIPVGEHVAHCYAVTRQPDGALVMAGGSDTEINFDDEYDATLVRLLPDGTLDPAFGDGGIVVRRTGERDFESVFTAVALAADGSIVAAGDESSASGGRTFVARFDASGHPDASFGEDGRVYVTLGLHSRATAVAVQSDGRVVVAASIWYAGALPDGPPGYDAHNDVALIRLAADGALDASFGDGGVRVIDLRSVEFSLDMVVQSEGGVVVAAALLDSTTFQYDVGLVRCDADGTRDRTWGQDGLTLLDLGFVDDRSRLIALPGDRLLVLSSAPGIALARIGRDGLLDPRFGVAGIARVGPDFWYGRAVTVDGRERPLVAVLDATGETRVGHVLRFSKNGRLRGRLDRSPLVPFDPGHVIMQPDGRVQVAIFDGASWLVTRLRQRLGAPERRRTH